MSYIIFDIIVSILDVFNNSIGISAVITAFVLGAILCKVTSVKAVIYCICVCFFVVVIGILGCIVGNTPELLGIPIFFIPFFVVLTVTTAAYYFFKWIINKVKSKNK